MSQNMRVIIATHGSAPLLERTLDSLARCVRPASFGGVIVVENGSRGPAQQIALHYEASLGARYLHRAEPSKCAALNYALGSLGDALAIFADDDVRFAPEYLEAYAKAAAQCAGARRFFGGPTAVDYEAAPVDWLKKHLPYSARGWEWSGGPDVDRPHFLGFNWAARVADLRAIGGFPEHLGPGAASGVSVGDENLVQRRLLASGLLGRYVPAARVWHYVPAAKCTPTWALERIYTTGVSSGINMQLRGVTLCGYPLSIGPRWIKGVVRRWVARTGGNEEFRFTAEGHWNYNRGFLRGLRLRRQMRREPQRSAAQSWIWRTAGQG
jgi:hypothetical protein